MGSRRPVSGRAKKLESQSAAELRAAGLPRQEGKFARWCGAVFCPAGPGLPAASCRLTKTQFHAAAFCGCNFGQSCRKRKRRSHRRPPCPELDAIPRQRQIEASLPCEPTDTSPLLNRYRTVVLRRQRHTRPFAAFVQDRVCCDPTSLPCKPVRLIHRAGSADPGLGAAAHFGQREGGSMP